MKGKKKFELQKSIRGGDRRCCDGKKRAPQKSSGEELSDQKIRSEPHNYWGDKAYRDNRYLANRSGGALI